MRWVESVSIVDYDFLSLDTLWIALLYANHVVNFIHQRMT